MKKLLILLVTIIGFGISANAQNTLTFYGWGVGANTPDGRSGYGHVFISINGEFWGFGRNEWKVRHVWASGGMHGDLSTYATVKISFEINSSQYTRVIQKINKWVEDEPDYITGNNDCTTFAMEIADAADIGYGSRWSIQSPIGFLERLKDYNPKATRFWNH